MSPKPRLAVDNTGKASRGSNGRAPRPTATQLAWLRRGLEQPGGKLPLFSDDGRRVSDRTVKACIDQGWAVSWIDNPIKPDWLICKLTEDGRAVAAPAKR